MNEEELKRVRRRAIASTLFRLQPIFKEFSLDKVIYNETEGILDIGLLFIEDGLRIEISYGQGETQQYSIDYIVQDPQPLEFIVNADRAAHLLEEQDSKMTEVKDK